MHRDEFLARVSRAVMATTLPPGAGGPERLPQMEEVDLVALFRARAQSVDAVVHGPMARHGVPRSVVGIAAGHGARSFMSWDDLPAPGVAAALATSGLSRVDHVVPAEDRSSHQLGYEQLDLGITGAVAGLAESGSVVLTHGPGRPRMASLIADVHVALLETAMMERTLAHWAARRPDAGRDTSNLVVVTGPSRTGDIELELNLGVHGPRHVHVILIR